MKTGLGGCCFRGLLHFSAVLLADGADDLVIGDDALPRPDGGKVSEILPLLEELHGSHIAGMAAAGLGRHVPFAHSIGIGTSMQPCATSDALRSSSVIGVSSS